MINSIRYSKRLFLFGIIIIISNSQIKIPLKYYPVNNYNYSTPETTFKSIIEQKLYANIEIGSPKKTIQIPLTFDSNDFYIVDYYVYDRVTNKDRYSDISFYNSSDSWTFDFIENDYHYTGDNFDCASYTKDFFYFNNKKTEMEFYYPGTPMNSESGGIGLLLYPKSTISDTTETIERTFLEKLRKKKLTQSYYWSIFYNSKENKKEEECFILIGCLPHLLNEKLGYYEKGYFNEKNKRKVVMSDIVTYIKNSFYIDLMFGYQGKNQQNLIEGFPFGNTDYKKIQLEYNSGCVQAPTDLKKHYDKIFEEFIIKGQCFNVTTNGWKSFSFYYCKKDDDVISKVKNVFPGINLRSHDLDYNFTLEADDLFMEENNKVFCLLYFPTSSNKNWVMGKPFLKKYLFTINHDEKYISFYKNIIEPKEKEKGQNRISTIVFIIAICGTITLVLLICFVLFKFYLFEKFFRKARVNELKDDEYDYVAKNDIDKNALNIN